MKVLFDHGSPFLLAHGGVQTQIEQTKTGLEANGVEVEFLRWWDERQTGDLIHYFGVPRPVYLRLAEAKGLAVVMTVLFSETCNRPDWKLAVQGVVTETILRLPFGEGVKDQLNWRAYRLGQRLVVGLEAEPRVLVKAFGVRASAVSVVPLGLGEGFLKAGPGARSESHLICTGTITPVKRSVELAVMAKAAEVPVLFVGKPYHPDDPYWRQFQGLIDGRLVKYRAHVEDPVEMVRLLQSAMGFVLASAYENWSLSASEAVACGLPLLLPDLKWSRERFGDQARYFAGDGGSKDVAILRKFYEDCAKLPGPKIKLWSWAEIGSQLRAIYEKVLKGSG